MHGMFWFSNRRWFWHLGCGFEEPLFRNCCFLFSDPRSSVSMQSQLTGAGCLKLGHPMKISVPRLAELLNIRSHRLLVRLVEEVCRSLPDTLRAFLLRNILWDEEHKYVFPSLTVSAAVGHWEEEISDILSLKTPELGGFESLGKKTLYCISVKVLNIRSLWQGVEVDWVIWHRLIHKGLLEVSI